MSSKARRVRMMAMAGVAVLGLALLSGCESEFAPPPPRSRAIAAPTLSTDNETLGPAAHPEWVAEWPRNKDDTMHVHSVLDTITTAEPATRPATRPATQPDRAHP